MPVPKRVVDEFEEQLDEYAIQLLDAFDDHAREYEKQRGGGLGTSARRTPADSRLSRLDTEET